MRIDHVLYAVGDLDEAGVRFEREHGLVSSPGGDHPLFGTGNRIVPLGDAYVELIAVTDPAIAAQNPIGRGVGALAEAGGGWLGWVVAVDDIEQRAARLGTVVIPGHRLRPDGITVSWRAAGMERMLEDLAFPFFIAWDDPGSHPGLREGAHGRLTIEVGCDAAALRIWLGDLPGWITVATPAGGVQRVLLDGRPIG